MKNIFTFLVFGACAIAAMHQHAGAAATVEHFADVVMVTSEDGTVDVVPIELFAPSPAAPVTETVDGVVIPERVWDCIDPAPVGCHWSVNSDCVDQAKQDYADAFNDAENEWWEDVEPHHDIMIACLQAAGGDPDESLKCLEKYNEDTHDYDVVYGVAISVALAAYLDADCCELSCGGGSANLGVLDLALELMLEKDQLSPARISGLR